MIVVMEWTAKFNKNNTDLADIVEGVPDIDIGEEAHYILAEAIEHWLRADMYQTWDCNYCLFRGLYHEVTRHLLLEHEPHVW